MLKQVEDVEMVGEEDEVQPEEDRVPNQGRDKDTGLVETGKVEENGHLLDETGKQVSDIDSMVNQEGGAAAIEGEKMEVDSEVQKPLQATA